MIPCDRYWQIVELNYIDMEVDIQAVLAKDIEISEEEN